MVNSSCMCVQVSQSQDSLSSISPIDELVKLAHKVEISKALTVCDPPFGPYAPTRKNRIRILMSLLRYKTRHLIVHKNRTIVTFPFCVVRRVQHLLHQRM